MNGGGLTLASILVIDPTVRLLYHLLIVLSSSSTFQLNTQLT